MNLADNAQLKGTQGIGLSRRGFIGGASFIAVAGFVSACTNKGTQAGGGGEPRTGGTLKISIVDASPNDKTDPAVGPATVTGGLLCSMIYSPLVRTGMDFKLQPCLAERWETSADGTTWTFHLRKGVTFHDGSPLTAKDVAWTFKRALDKNVHSILFLRFSSTLDASGITVVDDQTLQLKLKKPDFFFGEVLALPAAGIVKENQSTFTASTSFGTGPFSLKSFTPGESFEVVRNPKYFETGLPYLDGIQNTKIDPSAALAALASGTIDWTDSLDAKSIARLKGDARFRSPALDNPELAVRTYFLHMKLTEAPFNDPRVVQAMKLAANREEILKAVLSDLGTVTGDVPVPMSNAAYPKSVGKRPQDIVKAKQLLADAGYPNGIEVNLPTANIQPGMTDFSVAFAETVKQAGIKINIQQVPADTYFDKVFGQVPLFHDYGTVQSAYSELVAFFQKGGPYNATGFDEDGSLTKFLAAAAGEPDEAKRTQILSNALEYTANNSGSHIAFMVPILQTMRSRVNGDLFQALYSWEKMWLSA